MRFRGVRINGILKLFSFESNKKGITLLGFSLIPISITIFITQVFLNHEMTLESVKANDIYKNEYNVKYLIYYSCFGTVHILMSLIAIKQFKAIIRKNLSLIHSKQTIKLSYISWFLMGIIVILLDYFNINIAVFSHSKLYQFLEHNYYFKHFFLFFPKDIIGTDLEAFYLFSIFPFLLILLGIGVLGWGCFSIAKEINQLKIEEFKEKDFQKELLNFFAKLKSNIYLLSIVLVTSTIATIFYFKLPLPIIKDENVLKSYQDLSVSMGIFWGVMFSVTLLFLCVGSYHLLNKYLNDQLSNDKLKDTSKIANFMSNNLEVYSIVNNVKLIFTILSPSIASLITTTLIKSI